MALTKNARTVLEHRYLWRDREGRPAEVPEGMFLRVARDIAAAEKTPGLRKKWERRFVELMISGRFLPNTPTLLNAGRKGARGGQLSACFVLPIEDNLESIFGTLQKAALIHQSGGGTGFSFSALRPKGSRVRSSLGTASGPVSFMKIYDISTETIKQGGARRGANMAVLRVDHPDVEEFIDAKRDLKSITNFNISVGITDEFMRTAGSGGRKPDFALRDPGSGAVLRKVSARQLFRRMVRAAWECGDPGLIFLDRVNFFNPTPRLGRIESTNPCGERPLLPYESCNLGSLNVGRYWTRGRIDWESFEGDIETAVRFLDNVVDRNAYPVPECAEITRRNRKIGLGIMGFADLLLLLRIPYASVEARDLGERIMAVLDSRAKKTSSALAIEKGAFPNWKGSLWETLRFPEMRNATVSTVAPTGTISIIAGASSGIEPIYSGVFVRNVLEGERLLEIPPVIERVFAEIGLVVSGMSQEEIEERIEAVFGNAWSPAAKVPVRAHIEMQAAFQRHCDSAVSKTVNLPERATEADIAEAYWTAYRLGCKGITVYRDRSRGTQVLEALKDPAGCPLPEDKRVCSAC